VENTLGLEIIEVVEQAAIASSKWMGKGEKNIADQVAVEAMRERMNKIHMRGRIVIGEGERDEAPMLYIGEEVGSGSGPAIEIRAGSGWWSQDSSRVLITGTTPPTAVHVRWPGGLQQRHLWSPNVREMRIRRSP
jgi:hypothetical protein